MTFLKHEELSKANLYRIMDEFFQPLLEAYRPAGYKWTQADYAARTGKKKFAKTWIPVGSAKDAAIQARQMYPDIKWGFWGADVQTLNHVMPRLISLMNQYPNVAKLTKMVGTPTSFSANPGTDKGPHVSGIAAYHPTYRSILFNPQYFGEGKYESFKKVCESDYQSKFHPAPDISTVVTHEFGHMISGYLHKQFNQNQLPQHTHEFLTRHYLNKGEGLGSPTETSGYSTYKQNGDYYEWFAESTVALHHVPRAQWSAHTKALDKALKGSGA